MVNDRKTAAQHGPEKGDGLRSGGEGSSQRTNRGGHRGGGPRLERREPRPERREPRPEKHDPHTERPQRDDEAGERPARGGRAPRGGKRGRDGFGTDRKSKVNFILKYSPYIL